MRFGVEPICRVLTGHGCQIAPSTYYEAQCRPRVLHLVRAGRAPSGTSPLGPVPPLDHDVEE